MKHRKSIALLAAAAAVPLAALTVAAAGDAASGASASPKTAHGHAATLGVASNGKLGKILIDSRGRTLYLFKKDVGKKSACSGACAAAWPPLRVSGKPVAGKGASAAKIGTSARSDGKPQVTYNGHPLYTYVDDAKAGQTHGQGVKEFGALWYVVSPGGKQISGRGR